MLIICTMLTKKSKSLKKIRIEQVSRFVMATKSKILMCQKSHCLDKSFCNQLFDDPMWTQSKNARWIMTFKQSLAKSELKCLYQHVLPVCSFFYIYCSSLQHLDSQIVWKLAYPTQINNKESNAQRSLQGCIQVKDTKQTIEVETMKFATLFCRGVFRYL